MIAGRFPGRVFLLCALLACYETEPFLVPDNLRDNICTDTVQRFRIPIDQSGIAENIDNSGIPPEA